MIRRKKAAEMEFQYGTRPWTDANYPPRQPAPQRQPIQVPMEEAARWQKKIFDSERDKFNL